MSKWMLPADYELNGQKIPSHMHEPLLRYITEHSPVGGFLTAVLTNDLKEACMRADDQNLFVIPVFIGYLYNYAPSLCWGSQEQVKKWLEFPDSKIGTPTEVTNSITITEE